MRDAVLVMLLLVNAVFVCLGGLIFHLLEYYNEAWAHESLKLEFLKFLGNHSCVHPKILLDFTHTVVHHSQKGINMEDIELFDNISSLNWVTLELITSNRIWDYSSAFLFCVTVITTIGAVIIVMVPSVMFCFFLRWSFLDAVYYSVITLTTVGFGDLFPVEDKNEMTYLYRFLLSVWIFVGLCWVALVLTEVGTTIQRRIEMAAIKSAELSSIMSKKILKSPVSLRSQTVSPNNFNEEHSASV
ncbi:potassium channel subfamily K member 10-like isoform X2 [Biomphalaria glabrata]|uniref:Potassium channel subfamily K member 10-like isoform X2 n=1 Tax=Biomphalaria glabrata TaxID=6526 RepID=A0A2C9LRD7_BIOGL|nr:potassium channel subfamily K member 10-like isoform X2 [Biomphalaria glabrata]